MSDDVTAVDIPDLRGWAQTWDWMSAHLTTEQAVLKTTLENVEMTVWSSAVTEVDNAAGELLRSGIYATFVANAAEAADGGAYTVDHIGFAAGIFGEGGALSVSDERVYSEAINDHDRVLGGGGFGAPPPRATGSRPDAPAWTANPAPAASTPAERVFEVDTADAVLRPSVPNEGRSLDDAIVQDRPSFVGPVSDTPTVGLPTIDQGRPFGEDGIAGPVLPDAD